jgi:ADP-heptose:LPS heptosyltransferase
MALRDVLVIRLGALGDFALSFPAFAALRAHHAADRLTLLTTRPFADLARNSPWFDEVLIDVRPPWHDLAGLRRLRAQLAGRDLVYDLQTSSRSSRYFFLAGCPPWSGIAPFCSLPDADPDRNNLHTIERQQGQLRAAGVATPVPLDLGWLAGRGPALASRYALLIPGTSAAHGGAKRWPVARYGALAVVLARRGLVPVVAGSAAEVADAASILAACPEAVDLAGRTSLADLAGLAARAAVAIGGDTGPIHLAAMMGCPVVALFSGFSNPALAAPRGRVTLLREAALTSLSVERVAASLPAL